VWIAGRVIYGLKSSLKFLATFAINSPRDRKTPRLHIYAKVSMLSCMRTTLEISDELFRLLKRKAADDGTPLRQVVESALRVYLGKQTKRKGYQLRWNPERGRILPGVKLDDRDALFDLMDGRR